MSEEINIGLLGLGTVGRGVFQLVSRDNRVMANRLGAELRIKRILVQDPAKERGLPVPRELLTTDYRAVIDDPEIEIVVEVIGGTGVARRLVMSALGAGKSVVTANKELMAGHGQEVLAAAESQGVGLFFEAAVGAGIPIIHPLKELLVANRVQRVMGIVNGTTNFVLSRMEAGYDYREALKEAQALGFAERDPSYDVDGKDAAAKTAILASIAFNSRVGSGDVYTEGISAITPRDIMYARELGYVVKLLALAKLSEGALDVRVHPTMIPVDHPLAAVKEAFNAIFVEGDAVGELMFFGQGAGSLPTASAVVADVFLAARERRRSSVGQSACTCFNSLKFMPIEQVRSSFYLLIEAMDRPGVLAKIAKVFGDHQVSVSSVIQKEIGAQTAEVVFMTHRVFEGHLRAALTEIAGLDVVSGVRSVIRVEAGKE
jgi:homoserine dehydrogenase